jgi:hypothetical protein
MRTAILLTLTTLATFTLAEPIPGFRNTTSPQSQAQAQVRPRSQVASSTAYPGPAPSASANSTSASPGTPLENLLGTRAKRVYHNADYAAAPADNSPNNGDPSPRPDATADKAQATDEAEKRELINSLRHEKYSGEDQGVQAASSPGHPRQQEARSPGASEDIDRAQAMNAA